MNHRRKLVRFVLFHVIVICLWRFQFWTSDARAVYAEIADVRLSGFDLVADVLGLTNFAGWTLFVPGDAAVAFVSLSQPLADIIRYHIVPQWLSYKDLTSLPLGTKLSTLLPNKTLIVTSVPDDALSTDFTLDTVEILLPELYFDERIIVHGISDVMNPLIYGSAEASNVLEIPMP